MGSQCSATLPGTAVRACGLERPCGVPLDGFGCRDEDCQLCGEEGEQEHPPSHFDSGIQLRSPRGPVPPWVASSSSRAPVDRTATGATPPGSPRALRMTPPGLPDEELPGPAPSGVSLVVCVDDQVIQDLYAAAREGNAEALTGHLAQLSTAAIAQVCMAQGQPLPKPGAISADVRDKAWVCLGDSSLDVDYGDRL